MGDLSRAEWTEEVTEYALIRWRGRWAGSVGKAAYCQAERPEFGSPGPTGRKGEPTPEGCPLTSTCAQWHTRARTHELFLKLELSLPQKGSSSINQSSLRLLYLSCLESEGFQLLEIFQIREYLHMHNEVTWGWDPSPNTKLVLCSILLMCLFWGRTLYSPCWPQTQYIAEDDLEFPILPPLPECWGYRCAPPCELYGVLGYGT